MAYQTGVATSPTDLLDKLRLFLLSNGWTVNLWTTVGAGYRLHVQKGTLYFNFRSAVNENIFAMNQGGAGDYKYGIGAIGSDGYNVSNLWDQQPGSPTWTSYPTDYCGIGMQCRSDGVTAYYFFLGADPVDYCHVLIRFISPYNGAERWGYLSFGNVIKFGSWTGGAYLMANRPGYRMMDNAADSQYDVPPFNPFTGSYSGPAYLRINQGGVNGWATSGLGGSYPYNYGTLGDTVFGNCYDPTKIYYDATLLIPTYKMMYRSLANQLNGLAILMPITLFWHTNVGSIGNFSPLGNIPDMYFARVASLTHGNVYQFGGLNFIPAPCYKIDIPNLIVCGFACRQII